MTQTQREAAAALKRRALQTKNASKAELLIASAARLDPSIDADKVRSAWSEKWLKDNQGRQAARYE